MSSKRGGDYVLEQEKYSLEQVDLSMKEKDDLLKKAKDAAKKEIASYEETKREEYMEKTTKLFENTSYIKEIEEKNKNEISEIQKEFEGNKEKVMEYLFLNVITVDIQVPDVVKGFFERKFGIKEDE